MARLEFKDAKQVSLAELKQMVLDAKDGIYEMATDIGREVKVYMHWTAGWWNHGDDDYHILIGEKGEIYTTVNDLSIKLRKHTAGRNSGAISVAFCACALATSDNLGQNPPTEAMIDGMAMVNAVLCTGLEIPPDIEHLMTHGEAADNLDGYVATDPYGPDSTCERWDLAILANGDAWKSGGDTMRRKTEWYLREDIFPGGVENFY